MFRVDVACMFTVHGCCIRVACMLHMRLVSCMYALMVCTADGQMYYIDVAWIGMFCMSCLWFMASIDACLCFGTDRDAAAAILPPPCGHRPGYEHCDVLVPDCALPGECAMSSNTETNFRLPAPHSPPHIARPP